MLLPSGQHWHAVRSATPQTYLPLYVQSGNHGTD
jgi:hypothetical protein